MNTGFKRLLIIALVSIILFSTLPREASAEPYQIEGYLKDSNGLPITLANISLSGNVYDIESHTNIIGTLYTETNANGYYKFNPGIDEPGGFAQGSKLIVAYKTGDQTVDQEITIQGYSQWVNLTYEKRSISDILYSPIGVFSIIALFSVIFLSIYLYKSKSSKNNENDEQSDKKVPRKIGRRRRQR